MSRLLDPSVFSFVPPLEANYATFVAELERLSPEDFIDSPYEGAYQGTWLLFPLFFGTFGSGLEPLFPGNQAKCPETTKVLRSIPRVISGGFSWMDPGCRIGPHTDLQPPNVVRAHLGLRIPERTELRFGPDRFEWRTGRCLVFDGTVEHQTANLSDQPRVVLVVDAELDPDELAYLDRERGTGHGTE